MISLYISLAYSHIKQYIVLPNINLWMLSIYVCVSKTMLITFIIINISYARICF